MCTRTRTHTSLVQAAPQLLDAQMLLCPRPSLIPGGIIESVCTLSGLLCFNLPTRAPLALPPSLPPFLPVRHGRSTWVELGGAFQEGQGGQGLVVGLAGLMCKCIEQGKREMERSETYMEGLGEQEHQTKREIRADTMRQHSIHVSCPTPCARTYLEKRCLVRPVLLAHLLQGGVAAPPAAAGAAAAGVEEGGGGGWCHACQAPGGREQHRGLGNADPQHGWLTRRGVDLCL